MQPTLCSRCKKHPAVVFISKLEGDKTTNEGLCLACARKVGLPQVDEMMKRLGLSEEELESMSEEMMMAMSGPENMEDLPDDEDYDEEEEGKTATFPFLNRLFSGGDRAAPAPSDQEEKRESRKDPRKNQKRKFLDAYCICLTDRAKEGKLDPVIGRAEEIERVVQILNRRQK
ncbi:MAG: ATP-dependent Clp protease ATP-binding subunit, partial [Oscillibacter sp.]|nr:ATP-dependent Clp protease ATP-binding subunit [Oscillibacter sp.]